jgi:hypothetical protein
VQDAVYDSSLECIQKLTHTVLQCVYLCMAGTGHNFKLDIAEVYILSQFTLYISI